MTVQPGTRLGPYQILAPIGAGGMGQVYRARDTRLDRIVAVKILPPELASDPDRRLRLEREARAIAALNHPHVCALYDVGHQDGLSFLVMEYVDGEPLSARLARGPVPVEEAVRYARQIGEALDHAHKQGIVHRDLKPANVLVTPSGAKLVDFGLARLSWRTQVTEPGMLLGTPGYMSPEQLRGETADHRADIWALGALLYEMVTGTPPFVAERPEAVWRMILEEQPAPLHQRVKDASTALERTIAKALAKKKEDRFDSVSWFLAELDRASTAIDRGPDPSRLSARRRRDAWLFSLAAGGMVFVALAGWTILSRPPSRAVLQLADPIQVTAEIGVEDFPTWSPDGRMLAYESNSDGTWDIWVTQLGGTNPVNRTSGYSGADRFPSWSPDGSSIAFWSAREGGGLYVMPALSGRARKLPFTSAVGVRPVWSSDSLRLAAVSRADTARAIEILTIATGETRRVNVNAEIYELAWAPNGQFFACIEAQGATSEVSRLIVVRLSDQRVLEISGRQSGTWSPFWSADSRTLYYVSNRRGSMDLWQQHVDEDGPSGPAVLLTNGIGIRRAALAPSSGRLAYGKGRRVGNIWRLRTRTDRPAGWSDAEQLTWDEANVVHVDVSPDGVRLAFSSDRAGNQDLWVLRPGERELDRLTSSPAPELGPRWSPDGTSVAYYAVQDGNNEVFAMPASGGRVTRITREAADDLWPVWSPDGRRVAFYSERTGNMDIWTADREGSDLKRLTANPAYDGRPAWSPDGQWIAYRSEGTKGGALTVVPATGGPPKSIIRGRVGVCVWARDGVRVYCVADFSPAAELTTDRAVVFGLWEVDVRTGSARRLSDLTGKRGQIGDAGLTVHGQFLYFTWQEDQSDIWVMNANVGR